MNRIRHHKVFFCRVEGCQNLLCGKKTDFCHDPHRNLYHKSSRLIGHRVIVSAGYREAETMSARMAEMVKVAGLIRLSIRKPRPVEIDMDPMPPQERLGLLCRAAERMGVLLVAKEAEAP